MRRFLGYLAKAAVGAVMFGAMFGCAASLQPKTLDTGKVLSKEIRVRTHDLSGKPISESAVRDALAAALIAGGKLPTSYVEQFRGSFSNTSSFLTHGVRSKATTSGIKVEYLKGTKVTSTTAAPSFYESRIAATFPLTITKSDDGELYRAVLGFPAQVAMTPPPYMPFEKPTYFMSEEKVVPNLMSKYDALKEVAVAATAAVTGEVTVEAPPEAVRGNLERILGKFNKYSDTGNAYNLDVQGHVQKLRVELFPYRTGCKMQYSVDIPYTVSETTSLTEFDLQAVKRKVESVAKD